MATKESLKQTTTLTIALFSLIFGAIYFIIKAIIRIVKLIKNRKSLKQM